MSGGKSHQYDTTVNIRKYIYHISGHLKHFKSVQGKLNSISHSNNASALVTLKVNYWLQHTEPQVTLTENNFYFSIASHFVCGMWPWFKHDNTHPKCPDKNNNYNNNGLLCPVCYFLISRHQVVHHCKHSCSLCAHLPPQWTTSASQSYEHAPSQCVFQRCNVAKNIVNDLTEQVNITHPIFKNLCLPVWSGKTHK